MSWVFIWDQTKLPDKKKSFVLKSDRDYPLENVKKSKRNNKIFSKIVKIGNKFYELTKNIGARVKRTGKYAKKSIKKDSYKHK